VSKHNKVLISAGVAMQIVTILNKQSENLDAETKLLLFIWEQYPKFRFF